MAERRVKALELRKAGVSYRQIAEALGVDVRTAHRDVMHELEQIEKHAAELRPRVLQLELERADALWMASYPEAKRGHLGAIDRCVKIMERRAKLLGLDAATRVAGDENGAPIHVEVTNARDILNGRLSRLAERAGEGGDPGDTDG